MFVPESPKVVSKCWRRYLHPSARYAVSGFRCGSRRLVQIRLHHHMVSALRKLSRLASHGVATVLSWTADELSYLSRVAAWCRPTWQKLRIGSARVAQALWER